MRVYGPNGTALATAPLTARRTESGTFTVNAAGINNFLIEAAGGSNIGAQTAGVPFDIWITARDQWVQKTQPTLKGAEEASTLLDQLKQIAGKYNILIENPAIGSGETTPNHQAVFASIETGSHWPELVHFLYDVQQPDAFVVFESVNLVIDSNDATMMRGKFKIARWFAPANRKKA